MKNKTHNIIIEIAKLPIKILTKNLVILNAIKKDYKIFLSIKKPIFQVYIKFNKKINPFPNLKGGILPFRVDYYEGSISCKSPNLKGKINLFQKKAFLEIKNEISKPVQNFLRVVYSNMLLDKKGILIHSSSIIKNKKGYLFFGRSGSGKTTVSKSAIKKYEVVSDDISIIRKVSNEYKIYGSPFWGALGERLDNINESAKIICLFKIIKSNQNAIKKKYKKKAILDLICCASFLPNNKKIYKKAFELINDLTDNIQVYDLYFTKKCNFWSMINEIDKNSN